MTYGTVYARNPSFSPFFFANLINPCFCFASAPIDLQNSPITCECNAIPLPLSWLNCFFPNTFLVNTTIGAKTPRPSFLLPIRTCARDALPPAFRCKGAHNCWRLSTSPFTEEDAQFTGTSCALANEEANLHAAIGTKPNNQNPNECHHCKNLPKAPHNNSNRNQMGIQLKPNGIQIESNRNQIATKLRTNWNPVKNPTATRIVSKL